MKICWKISDKEIDLETEKSLFSPEAIDKGTLAMLETARLEREDKLLDLGCGYGTVGIYAALAVGIRDITMTDVNADAVECARRNVEACIPEEEGRNIKIVQGDGLEKVEDRDFTVIMSNPPYHADFSVPKHFIEDGYRHLKTGGRMVMVTKRRTWYENKLKAVFGGVRVTEADGYYIFTAEKRSRAAKETSKAASSKSAEGTNKEQTIETANKANKEQTIEAAN